MEELIDSESFELLREAVRRFVENRLMPAEAETAASDRVAPSIVQEMRDLGLFGLSIPPRWGGLGLTMLQEVQLVFELGRASPAFRSTIGTNVGIGSQAIVLTGTEEQKDRYLPPMASGEIIGSFALTEPDAGSDAGSIKTQAAKDPSTGDWIINGTKRFITNAPQAGLFTLFARTGPEKGAKGVSCFLIEAKTPGLHLGVPNRKMGQQGAQTCDVILENVRVPAQALLGAAEGRGFSTAMKVLDKGRLDIAAACVGAAQRLIEESVRYASTRRQFGQPIAEFQLIKAMLADSYAEMYAAKAMVLDAAEKRDRSLDVILEASSAKMFASEMVGRVADRAVQIHGGSGYMAEYAVERFYRDVRLFRLYEGTTQIQQLVIARELLARYGS